MNAYSEGLNGLEPGSESSLQWLTNRHCGEKHLTMAPQVRQFKVPIESPDAPERSGTLFVTVATYLFSHSPFYLALLFFSPFSEGLL